MLLKFLGLHNARSSITRFTSLIIDNVLALDAGSLATGLTFAEQERVRSVLLTHGHFDHIDEIPAFAFNNMGRTIRVYGTKATLDMVSSHLIDGAIYPKYTEKLPFTDKPVLEFIPLEPLQELEIEGYQVKAVTVNHSIDAVGFEISPGKGRNIFYTGDTGFGLSALLPHINPRVLIVDLTFPNQFEQVAIESKHLCPRLLGKELADLKQAKGYLPEVIPVHLSPKYEKEIRKEMDAVARESGIKIINVPKTSEINI